jgi:small subunit ribosomal protein S12e
MAETDLNVNLQKLLKLAGYEDKLSKGLHEVCKSLESNYGDNKKVELCILAEDCQEADYKKLITALCKQYSIPLLKVKSRKELGEWVGLCKYDATNTARKVRGCSSCVIRQFSTSEEGASAVNIVKQHL